MWGWLWLGILMTCLLLWLSPAWSALPPFFFFLSFLLSLFLSLSFYSYLRLQKLFASSLKKTLWTLPYNLIQQHTDSLLKLFKLRQYKFLCLFSSSNTLLSMQVSRSERIVWVRLVLEILWLSPFMTFMKIIWRNQKHKSSYL